MSTLNLANDELNVGKERIRLLNGEDLHLIRFQWSSVILMNSVAASNSAASSSISASITTRIAA